MHEMHVRLPVSRIEFRVGIGGLHWKTKVKVYFGQHCRDVRANTLSMQIFDKSCTKSNAKVRFTWGTTQTTILRIWYYSWYYEFSILFDEFNFAVVLAIQKLFGFDEEPKKIAFFVEFGHKFKVHITTWNLRQNVNKPTLVALKTWKIAKYSF